MQISLIMPVFNCERFLPEALASVAAQTYAPFEVIFVDGPSTDATPQIAQSFPGSRYVRQSGEGMWVALNEGLALVRGNAVAFLSSDDLWHADKLRVQNEWLEAHPETTCVFSHVRYTALDEGSPLRHSKPEIFDKPLPAYLTENILARREVFERIGTFPVEYRVSSDMDWFGRLMDSHETIELLPQVLLTKRFHQENLSTRPSSGAAYNRELLLIMRAKILRMRKTTHGT